MNSRGICGASEKRSHPCRSQGRRGGYSFGGDQPLLSASSAAGPSSARTASRPADARAIDEILLLLARGVQQFHTYPTGSPICQQAVDACLKALVALESRDTLMFRVSPNALVVDETSVGAGTLIEQELARRLHQASIAQVTIERAVSPRELARFCADLVRCGERSAHGVPLTELLTEHGVKRIALRPAYRPEVLSVPVATEPVQELIDRERTRREDLFSAGGPVNHLYPPDKGWVRVDPSTPLGTVSLIDLTLLAENPAALAGMLVRLTDGESADAEPAEDALSRKYSEVATLFGALDPRLARVMFAKLARAGPGPRFGSSSGAAEEDDPAGTARRPARRRGPEGLSRSRAGRLALPVARPRSGRARGGRRRR